MGQSAAPLADEPTGSEQQKQQHGVAGGSDSWQVRSPRALLQQEGSLSSGLLPEAIQALDKVPGISSPWDVEVGSS